MGIAAAEPPEAHPVRRVQGDGLDGEHCQTGPHDGAVRRQHHLPTTFEDLDFLPHGPRLPIGVRRGSGGEDSVAGRGDVDVEGAKRPGSTTEAQVERESAGEHADLCTDGRCAARAAQLVATSSRFMPEASRRLSRL